MADLSVGILFTVKDGNKEGVVLQKRGDSDSFARAAQVTAHGGLEPHEANLPGLEGFSRALVREIGEELGTKVLGVFEEMMAASAANLVLLDEAINEAKGKKIMTFGMKLPHTFDELQGIATLEKGSGGLVFCDAPDSIQTLSKEHKASGVAPGELRMFDDEKRAVQRAFEKLIGGSVPSPEDRPTA